MWLSNSSAFYKSDIWKRLSRKCKERDSWTCTKCGYAPPKRERYRLHAHHVISRPDLPYATALDVLSNLRTQCPDCHQEEHSHHIRGSAKQNKMFRARRRR